MANHIVFKDHCYSVFFFLFINRWYHPLLKAKSPSNSNYCFKSLAFLMMCLLSASGLTSIYAFNSSSRSGYLGFLPLSFFSLTSLWFSSATWEFNEDWVDFISSLIRSITCFFTLKGCFLYRDTFLTGASFVSSLFLHASKIVESSMACGYSKGWSMKSSSFFEMDSLATEVSDAWIFFKIALRISK